MEELQSKLFEAATLNSITSLHQLLKDDPLILDRGLVNRFNETPLHVAAMLGHVDFVKEMIAMKPQLINELNSQRSSPLHLASAKGHADVVKALVSVDNRACLDLDRNEMSPLHLAAAKGHLEVMNLLLHEQPEAMFGGGGGGGESILHLCVKRYRLEALRLLVKKSDCDKEFVNSKDSDGNTLLHLAVADKQVETIKYLVSVDGVEVNALNNEWMTALDILIRSRRDLRDSEIERSLKKVGGFGTLENNTNNNSSSIKNRRKSLKKQKPYDGWVENKKSSLMVVASLIATMAFQVGANPPGTLLGEDKLVDSLGEAVLSSPHASQEGDTYLFSLRYPQLCIFFCIVNTIAFVASLFIILLLTSGLPIKRRIFMWILMVITWIAILAIALCYLIVITVVSPICKRVLLAFLIVWIVLIALLLIPHTIRIIVKLVKNFKKTRMRRSRSTGSTGLAGP